MDTKPTPTPKLTGRTIAALLAGGPRVTLVVHADGKLDTPDLADEPLPTTSRVVRVDGVPCARLWADGHLTLATEIAEPDASKLGTLRAAAARLANDELAEQYAQDLAAWQARADAAAAAAADAVEQVVPTPPARPALAVLPRPRGRHAAPRSEATVEAETHALCALLDELEEADLLRAS